MGNKTTEDLRVKRTHKLLYNALLELMETHAFENITVKQICDLAMVHRTTFYTHFQDKFELLSRALGQIADEEFKDIVDVSFSPSDNFRELFSLAMKRKKLFSYLLAAEERDSLRNLLRREMGRGMKKYLTEHNSMEEIPIDMQIKIEAHIGAVLGVLTWWIESKMPIDLEEIYTKMNIFSEGTFAE
ncbi:MULTISPECIES: TetR/AcrR family transcriptional regulator C-terminal domain-containing protein [Paenibacillus]|uniref:TetR/AcrR family transcriptional regulator C-terminal domain-containing protein n=1 Tax=Paenibacillus TaxID=44249 RepID=UPI0022B8976E|nr:TetR/AcrR family transcriptional regulator C-terminal domain-containing protein [Paenibacillus caseinilyticus]MCZ8523051.1 TetR/AcrR family transcriptional regulator C-terminal domain-containing protein [Paenibacillus caseinilyticus]